MQQIFSKMRDYAGNARFQSLPEREQQIVAFHDVVNPLSPHDGIESTLDLLLAKDLF